jgi:hypothetical protein
MIRGEPDGERFPLGRPPSIVGDDANTMIVVVQNGSDSLRG